MPVRNARAVVCRGPDRPFEVETIRVEPPRRNEVTIRLAACGVCHSDLSATNGTIPMPPPLVLGHEGAGVVVEIGEGVTELAVGDSVVTSFVSMCGHCRYCQTGRPQLCDQAARTLTTLPDGSVRSFDTDNQPLSVFSGCGVMGEFATLHVDNVVKIDAAMPLEPACLIACGVMTGVGAAFNTARVEAGSSVVVFGCGGVGLSAIQGSSIAGAASIIAVDTMAHKLEFARLRKGGTAVVVGVAAQADTTSVRTASLTFEEKTLTGSMYGSARPRQDFPRLIALYRSGRLKLDELITQRYTIEQAAQAFADLQAGHNARGVIVFDPD
ncbi:MAG: alcohol dehydrogenase [Thiomonas sp. 15-63-373]|nr:MAG: alcohol dehydrogenase [Thiomonas sp. 15-63-373]